MLLIDPRSNCLKDAPPTENLDGPEARRQEGGDVELGEVAMWYPPSRQVIEKTRGIPVGAWRGRTRAIDEEAVAQGGWDADREGLRRRY